MKKLALELKNEIRPKDLKITLVKGEHSDTRHVVFEPQGKYGVNAIEAVKKRLRLKGIPAKSGGITSEIWLTAADYNPYLKTLAPKERQKTKKQLAQEIEQSKRIRKLYGELLKLKFKEKIF